jgi:hypothetical protein
MRIIRGDVSRAKVGDLLSMTRTTATRNVLMASMLLGALFLFPATALGVIEGPCSGSVTIDGVTYTEANDSADDPIVIPDEPGLIASWTGQTDNPITNHQGRVGIVIGPTTVEIEDWGGANAEEATSASGDYAVDDAKDFLPFDLVGLYELEGSHSGDGGTCEGSVMVLIEGNAATSPVGIASIVGTLAAGTGVVMAGRRKGVA